MTHFKMIKIIIFDLDDTLYPEIEFVMSGFRAVSRYISKKYNIHYMIAEVYDIYKRTDNTIMFSMEKKYGKNMIEFLENKWKNKVCYTCESCLEIAYTSELSNTTGYVTDDELIESSNNKLQHK